MKKQIIKTVTILIVIFSASQKILADTHYVSLTGGHISPFTSLGNAATNIQDAVDAASVNDEIILNNGRYFLDTEIYVTNKMTVKSANGRDVIGETTVSNSANGEVLTFLAT